RRPLDGKGRSAATFIVDASNPAAEPVDAAARALEAGGLVVFGTETVYGIAARADDALATAALFDAKRRPRGLALPVMARDAAAPATPPRSSISPVMRPASSGRGRSAGTPFARSWLARSGEGTR